MLSLAAVDIERWPPVLRDQGKGKRQWRVRYVRAADVESPGDILRIGDKQRVGAEFLQFGTDAFELVRCSFAGEFELAQSCGARRRSRAVAPQRVNRIAVDRNQFRAGAGAGLSQFFHLLAGVKPGVVAKLRTFAQILFEPLLGRVLHKMLDRENLAVDLCRCLHRVAPVDEQRRAVGQDHRRACRAGKSRQPGQPFFACAADIRSVVGRRAAPQSRRGRAA